MQRKKGDDRRIDHFLSLSFSFLTSSQQSGLRTVHFAQRGGWFSLAPGVVVVVAFTIWRQRATRTYYERTWAYIGGRGGGETTVNSQDDDNEKTLPNNSLSPLFAQASQANVACSFVLLLRAHFLRASDCSPPLFFAFSTESSKCTSCFEGDGEDRGEGEP